MIQANAIVRTTPESPPARVRRVAPLRILFFSSEFPNPIDPTRAVFNRSLVHALARKHAVHVVSPIAWKDELVARMTRRTCVGSRTESSEKVDVDFPRYYHIPLAFRAQYGHFLWWSVGRRLLTRIANFRPDCIVTYWAHPDGEVAIRAARQFDIPAIVMVGGSDVLLLGRRGRRRRAILNVLKSADAVIPVSHHLAEMLKKDGVSPHHMQVVYRGVDQSLFHPGDRVQARTNLGLNQDETIFVSVGRLVPVKDFATIVSACRRLADENVPFRCHIIGDGPLRRAIQQQIDREHLSDRVHLRGSVPPAQLADWYRAADLTLLSSRSEGIPNVLLESMACGGRFVATDVGGIPEIADPLHDRLVPLGDVVAFANTVAESLKQGSATTARRFHPSSWDESAERLTSVIGGTLRP